VWRWRVVTPHQNFKPFSVHLSLPLLRQPCVILSHRAYLSRPWHRSRWTLGWLEDCLLRRTCPGHLIGRTGDGDAVGNTPFTAGTHNDGFLAAPPIPPAGAGHRLSCADHRRGLRLPDSTRRLALIAIGRRLPACCHSQHGYKPARNAWRLRMPAFRGCPTLASNPAELPALAWADFWQLIFSPSSGPAPPRVGNENVCPALGSRDAYAAVV
jgi:hypothetical protein